MRAGHPGVWTWDDIEAARLKVEQALNALTERAEKFFLPQDFTDLQVLSQIAWFDEFFLADPDVAGAVESIATILAVYNGVIPPTVNSRARPLEPPHEPDIGPRGDRRRRRLQGRSCRRAGWPRRWSG